MLFERAAPGWGPSCRRHPGSGYRPRAPPWRGRHSRWARRDDPRVAARSRRSSLVSDFPQEPDSRGGVLFGFDALGRLAIDDAEYASTLLCFRDDRFDRIGSGAKNGADFG